MNRLIFTLLMIVMYGSAIANGCIEKDSELNTGTDVKRVILCLSEKLEGYEKNNQALISKVTKLEKAVYENKSTISKTPKIEKNLKAKENTYSMDPLFIQINSLKRNGEKIEAVIEYKNTSKKVIEISLSRSVRSTYLVDDNGIKWNYDGKTSIGEILPGKKLLTKTKFLPQGPLDGKIFTFRAEYFLGGSFMVVIINDISL